MSHYYGIINLEYNGDFNDQFYEDLSSFLINKYPQCGINYNCKVLLPIILRWIVMISFEVNGESANFYLKNGGSNNIKDTESQFLKKIKKRKGFSFITD